MLPSFWSSATSSCENPSILQKYCAENVMKIMPNIYGELVNGNSQGLRISYYFFFNSLLSDSFQSKRQNDGPKTIQLIYLISGGTSVNTWIFKGIYCKELGIGPHNCEDRLGKSGVHGAGGEEVLSGAGTPWARPQRCHPWVGGMLSPSVTVSLHLCLFLCLSLCLFPSVLA